VVPPHYLVIVSDWVVMVAFWVVFLLPAGLATFWRWWETYFGWSIVLMDLPVVLALSPDALHRLFNLDVDTLFFQWFVVAAIGLVPIVTIWRMWVLLETQRGGKRYRDIWTWKLRKGKKPEPQHSVKAEPCNGEAGE
jgi:hypothetical protein